MANKKVTMMDEIILFRVYGAHSRMRQHIIETLEIIHDCELPESFKSAKFKELMSIEELLLHPTTSTYVIPKKFVKQEANNTVKYAKNVLDQLSTLAHYLYYRLADKDENLTDREQHLKERLYDDIILASEACFTLDIIFM